MLLLVRSKLKKRFLVWRVGGNFLKNIYYHVLFAFFPLHSLYNFLCLANHRLALLCCYDFLQELWLLLFRLIFREKWFKVKISWRLCTSMSYPLLSSGCNWFFACLLGFWEHLSVMHIESLKRFKKNFRFYLINLFVYNILKLKF